jgi:DNA-binding response OmpR family regulator
MTLPKLEAVRLLKPRLGFGSSEERVEEVRPEIDKDSVAQLQEAPEPVRMEEPTRMDDLQAALERLSDHLQKQSAAQAPLTETGPPIIQVDFEQPEAKGAAVREPEREPEPTCSERPAPPQQPVNSLCGCKVAAIGFGRQDFAGLAAAMIEERARIEFLPQGNLGGLGEFDLFLVNCASADVLKRGAPTLKAVLASGTPAIVIGSRAALSILRAGNDRLRWDFAAKPLHMDELIWRAQNLLSRREAAGVPRTLPRRVVVADNDPFARTLVESALTSQGFGCELVEDGDAAWAAIQKSEPGAVILDLTLPNRDGFQLMADIRRTSGRKPKVMVLSARQSEADILRAFALGADDYVTKPFSPLELHARLTRLLGGVAENV